MEAVRNLFVLIAEISQWENWQWREPQWLWLLAVLPFFFYRSRRSRRYLLHPEPHFFKSTSPLATFIRYLGLLCAGIALAGFLTALGHPVIEKKIEERSGVPSRVYAIIDTSGSMSCNRYASLVKYFDTLMERSERQKLQVEFGAYFFSNTNLLQMFPGSPQERIIRTIARFGPKCQEISTYLKNRYAKEVNKAMGSGAGTEPAPSVLEIVFEVIRSGAPELEPLVRRIQEEKGFADTGQEQTIPISRYFPENRREEIIRKLREATRASRVLFLTDAEFGINDATLSFSRVAELAALIKLPIDLIVFNSSAWVAAGTNLLAKDVITVLKPANGFFTDISSVNEISLSAPAVQNLIKIYETMPANVKTTSKTIADETPRQSLFSLSLLALVAWVTLRTIYSIVDY